MPWSGPDFQAHHNHHLGIAQAAHAALVANAILRRTGDEGLAIRTANAREGHRDYGGPVDSGSGIGGVTPSAQSASPIEQGMIKRYSSLPVERLQELSSMLGSSPQGQIVQRLLAQKRVMSAQAQPQQQTLPAAPSIAAPAQTAAHRGGTIQHRDAGGMMSSSMASPWWTRREATADNHSGFLAGPTAGRADALHTAAPGGSYIIPADVVAGLGEGNSLAGAKVVDLMLRTGPWGTPQAQGRAGRGPPAAPHPMAAQAKGGDVQGNGEPVPVALSHGEFIVMPEHVTRIGGGNLKQGHRNLDAWVQLERKNQIKKLKGLPPPVGAKKAA